MNFEVIWAPKAEQELAAIWIAAPNRFEITAATHRLDEKLRHHPEEIGESRASGRRVAIEMPLGAMFRVKLHEKRVYVLSVWHVKKRYGGLSGNGETTG